MSTEITALNEKVKQESRVVDTVLSEGGKVIVGQEQTIQNLLITLFARGHALLIGVPGLAKTLLVKTLAGTLGWDFKRIQFTPDLLPADLIGTSIYNPKEGTFRVSKGPIFTNILLADEINRAPAKVQSALLEVMQKRQVTIGVKTFIVGKPFLVLATQNPTEHEGTYPLPEAQTDHFMMKVRIDYPSQQEEKEIVHRMATLKEIPEVSPVLTAEKILETRNIVNQVYVDDKVTEYLLKIVFATRKPEDFGIDIARLVMYGVSLRASIGLTIAAKAHAFLMGRAYVIPTFR